MSQFRPSGFNILPVAVKNLLIINGLMYLATVVASSTFGIDLVEQLGLYYIGSTHFKPFQFVSHLFMHGSFMHIFSNMFALWMFGAVLENVWGPKRFMFYYLVTGLGAAMLHSAVIYYEITTFENKIENYTQQPTYENFSDIVKNEIPSQYRPSFDQLLSRWNYEGDNETVKENSMHLLNQMVDLKKDVPTVGASGAVFGVLLAFGMLFPNTYIYLYFFFPIKAKYFVALYALFELYSGIQSNPADNVAHFAHLGGMLFGFFLIKFWNKRNRSDFF